VGDATFSVRFSFRTAATVFVGACTGVFVLAESSFVTSTRCGTGSVLFAVVGGGVELASTGVGTADVGDATTATALASGEFKATASGFCTRGRVGDGSEPLLTPRQ